MEGPSVLCPIDFSDPSRGALRYARAIATHFGATLHVLAVRDPDFEETVPVHLARSPEDTAQEIDRFVQQTLVAPPGHAFALRKELATGKPAPEILRVSRDRQCDLIVMSSHGLTGVRKFIFGSTTERVLRTTTVPVLVTPASDPGPDDLDQVPGIVRRVLAPVDLSPATPHQIRFAAGLADALEVPIVLLHIIEPGHLTIPPRPGRPNIDAGQRVTAQPGIQNLLRSIPAHVESEGLVVCGEPSEEIARISSDRDTGLIVMGLHSSPFLGPRMGSITYRVLCHAHRLVLALPPVSTHRLLTCEVTAEAVAFAGSAW